MGIVWDCQSLCARQAYQFPWLDPSSECCPGFQGVAGFHYYLSATETVLACHRRIYKGSSEKKRPQLRTGALSQFAVETLNVS